MPGVPRPWTPGPVGAVGADADGAPSDHAGAALGLEHGVPFRGLLVADEAVAAPAEDAEALGPAEADDAGLGLTLGVFVPWDIFHVADHAVRASADHHLAVCLRSTCHAHLRVPLVVCAASIPFDGLASSTPIAKSSDAESEERSLVRHRSGSLESLTGASSCRQTTTVPGDASAGTRRFRSTPADTRAIAKPTGNGSRNVIATLTAGWR